MDIRYKIIADIPVQDREGSVIVVIGGNGEIKEWYRYDAFGAPTIYDSSHATRPSSLINNRFLFTGREYVSKFGFYEYRARAYHPTIGRFMSEDPILFDAGDYNLFRYVGNDPLDRVDPMGLTDIEMSPKLIRMIIQASVNSRNEAISRGDGHDRSQYVLQNAKTGALSLQKKFNVGEQKRETRLSGGRFKTDTFEFERGKPDAGTRVAASGHVHMNVTGQPLPHSAEWSGSDRATARGHEATRSSPGKVGTPVGLALESDPKHVKILVPQKEPGLKATERTYNVPAAAPAPDAAKVEQQQGPAPDFGGGSNAFASMLGGPPRTGVR